VFKYYPCVPKYLEEKGLLFVATVIRVHFAVGIKHFLGLRTAERLDAFGFRLRCDPSMAEWHSDTLKEGDAAPDFSLSAADRPGPFTLTEARARGPAIVEFLRGTW